MAGDMRNGIYMGVEGCGMILKTLWTILALYAFSAVIYEHYKAKLFFKRVKRPLRVRVFARFILVGWCFYCGWWWTNTMMRVWG
jgi:hypothetical protein